PRWALAGYTAGVRGGAQEGMDGIPGGFEAPLSGSAWACPQPTASPRPAVVLDPFGGTGTTALVAAALGRIGITVDRSADYCRLAQWRTTDPGERARAMRVDRKSVV